MFAIRNTPRVAKTLALGGARLRPTKLWAALTLTRHYQTAFRSGPPQHALAFIRPGHPQHSLPFVRTASSVAAYSSEALMSSRMNTLGGTTGKLDKTDSYSEAAHLETKFNYAHENLTKKIDHIKKNLTEKFGHVDEKINQVNKNLTEKTDHVKENLTEKFDHVDEKFDRVDEKLGQVEKNLNEVINNINENLTERINNVNEKIDIPRRFKQKSDQSDKIDRFLLMTLWVIISAPFIVKVLDGRENFGTSEAKTK